MPEDIYLFHKMIFEPWRSWKRKKPILRYILSYVTANKIASGCGFIQAWSTQTAVRQTVPDVVIILRHILHKVIGSAPEMISFFILMIIIHERAFEHNCPLL